ncbi:MAG: efflux RND transporter periplasmic adaptor subunit [Bacteroidia bacterium]
MKNKIIIISISAILIAGGFYYFTHSKSKTNTFFWRTAIAEKGDLNVIITATGNISADTSVDVGTQVSGVLVKRYVDFNSKVKKGQLIALVDTTTLYATEKDAEAAVEKAQSTLNEYKRELDRSKNLFDNKVESQADYDLATTNYETSKSALTSAEAQLYKAQVNLRYAKIKAPISGIVIARNIDEGQTVIASFNTPTLFTIANDLSKMQVQADVGEADIGQIKVGQNVNFTVDAYPDDVFTGIVEQVRLQPVTIQNVVNYVVIINAPNPETKLIPGLTANVNILVHEQKGVLKVPSNAISFVPPAEYLESSDTPLPDSVKQKWRQKITLGSQKIIQKVNDPAIAYMWIKHNNDIFPTRIRKGFSDGVFTEISGDIKEGDEVAIGVNKSQASSSASQPTGTQNPFMPKFPTSKKK